MTSSTERPVRLGHIGEILAVIADGDFDTLVGRRDAGGEIARGDCAGKRFGRQPFRPEPDHQGAGGGHHVLDAVDRIGFERGKQRQRLVEIGEFDKQDCQADGQKTHRDLRRDKRNRGYR
jgi:hypothetical protein